MTLAEFQVSEALSWVTNWLAWNSMATWSDMGAFSLYGWALALNRLLYLSLVPLLLALALQWFGRQEFDATRILHRLRPRALLLSGLRLLPFAVPPVLLASLLFFGGRAGDQGPDAEEAAKNYWRRKRRDLDRLPDALGFPRRAGRRTRAVGPAPPRCPAPTRS